MKPGARNNECKQRDVTGWGECREICCFGLYCWKQQRAGVKHSLMSCGWRLKEIFTICFSSNFLFFFLFSHKVKSCEFYFGVTVLLPRNTPAGSKIRRILIVILSSHVRARQASTRGRGPGLCCRAAAGAPRRKRHDVHGRKTALLL